MKYAFLTTTDYSMDAFMIPFAYKLKEKGVDITLICNMSAGFLKKYGNDFRCINIEMERGIHIKNLLSCIKKLKKIFKTEKFDAIEYGTENMSFVAALAGKKTNIQKRLYNHWGILYIGFSGFKRLLVKRMERMIVKNSTFVRQVSASNLKYCYDHKLYDKKTNAKVLGKGGTIGVDLNKYDVKSKELFNDEIRKKFLIPMDATILGFVGRIQKDKGVDELIESFRFIYEKNANSYLVLCGSIDDSKPISRANMEYATNLPNIIFAGKVGDVEKYMSSFDLLVHPSYREGFGMVLQEAGAVKTPIVTTNIMGPADFIENGVTGLLVESRNVDALYNGISFMLENESKRQQMADACYKNVISSFAREKMLNQMLEDRIDIINS